MKKGFILTFIGNLTLFVLSFFNGYLLIRNLGSAGKGEIAFLLSLHQIALPIISLGLKQSLSYFEKKYVLKRSLLNSYITVSTLISILGTLFFYSFAWIVIGGNITIYLLLFVNTFGTYLLSFSSANAIKKENFYLINAIRISPAFTTLIGFSILILLEEWSIENTLVIYSFSTIISILIHKPKEIKYLNLKNIQWDMRIGALFYKGIQYALPLFILYLIYKVDIVILKFLRVTNNEIGYYSLAVNFAEVLLQLPSILSIGIFTLGISRDKKAFKKSIDKILKYSFWILIPLIIIYERLLSHFIPLIYGYEFSASITALKFLLIGSLSMVFYTIKFTHLASTYGKPKLGIPPLILSLIINISLNFLLIPKLGITGAAISTCIAYTLLYIMISKTYSKYVH